MKLTVTIDGHESYLVLKDRWSRRDLRDWDQAGDVSATLTEDERSGAVKMPAPEERLARAEARMMTLLGSWCSDAYLVVSPERTVKRPNELTPDDMLDMDASLYRFLMAAPATAFSERSRLGEPTVERSSSR